jgi:hypothetical protein
LEINDAVSAQKAQSGPYCLGRRAKRTC